MKTFVLAVLYICSLHDQTQCDTKELQVEKSACSIRQFEAKTPAMGQWHDVTVRLYCKG